MKKRQIKNLDDAIKAFKENPETILGEAYEHLIEVQEQADELMQYIKKFYTEEIEGLDMQKTTEYVKLKKAQSLAVNGAGPKILDTRNESIRILIEIYKLYTDYKAKQDKLLIEKERNELIRAKFGSEEGLGDGGKVRDFADFVSTIAMEALKPPFKKATILSEEKISDETQDRKN